jgi:hypothetical protein
MSPSTRQLQRVSSERWLYRTERGDYGPVTTDRIFAAIRERTIDLSTQVSVLGSNRWSAAGEFPLFRDHYAACQKRWDEDKLEQEAEALGKRIELQGHASRGAGLLVIAGIIAGLVVGGIVVWRLLKAEPLGLAKIVRPVALEPLPAPPPIAKKFAALPIQPERKIPRLSEPESYDTAGVAVGDFESGHVTKMHFSEDGEVAMISAADLERIVESARQGLYACAREALQRNPSFPGTDVGFTVAPGRLGKVSVGAEARANAPFKACVKVALARVKVPNFGGSERRVTVPLRFQR